MAPPPAKRQKRFVALSSDDDENPTSSSEKRHETKATSDTRSETPSDQTSSADPTNRSLPSRSRTKTTKAHSKLSPFTATHIRPNATPKNLSRKSEKEKDKTSRPISAFFENTISSQQPKKQGERQAAIPEVDVEEQDVIEDDSPVEDVYVFRGSQNTTRSVLDRRKEDLAPTGQAELPKGSRKFKMTNNALKNSTENAEAPSASAANLRPWAERFGPANLEELAVHKKKVSDVRSWLNNVLQGWDLKRILILKGPSGAGKTATVSALAKAMDFSLTEWRNPIGSEFSSEGYLSLSAQFEEFLGRSGRFNRLAVSDSSGNACAKSSPTADTAGEETGRRVILLEEFPNTFVGASSALQSFRSSILQFLAINTPSMGALPLNQHSVNQTVTPLVLIITEIRLTTTATSDSFTTHRLLGSEILTHPGISIIDFNPIASTFLTKALDLVIQKEARQSGRRRVPGASLLRKLGEIGDVRSAIGSLEFLCLRGEDGADWGGSVASKTKKGKSGTPALTKMEKESLEMVTQRESSLGLFHAVGKVVYNKREEINSDQAREPPQQPPDHLADHARPRISQVSVDRLIDETGTDVGTFTAALHENYVLSCEGVLFTDTINSCLNALSDSDILHSSKLGDYRSCTFQGAASDSLRQEEISFQLAVRGLLFALPNPVKRRAHPTTGSTGGNNDIHKMFYPISMRLSRQIEEVDELVDRWTARLRASNVPLGQTSINSGLQFSGLQSQGRSPNLTEFKQALHPSDQGDSNPMQTGLFCTKSEMVLERLPFISKIEQCNPAYPNFLELEKITQFRGISVPNNDISEEEDLNEASSTADWTIDRPAESRPKTQVPPAELHQAAGQGAKEANTLALPVGEELEKLYLSEDDIEDN